MTQPDKPGSSATSRKGSKKPQPDPKTLELETRIAEMMQARDAAQKQAMELHASIQDLSRRTGDLENQAGELDEELKKSREATRDAQARAERVPALEQEIASLHQQLEKVQSWAAELSAKATAAAAAERALREEIERTREHHDTVVRAKDERVAALENRAKEGMKRLKDAHDAALREQAARATASEHEAREELKKLRELHESMLHEASPLRTQAAELKERAEKAEARAADLHKDIDALSVQVGQSVGVRDKMRRELDEARSLLAHEREDAKKAAELRDASERDAAALRTTIADLERKAKEPLPPDPNIAWLERELAAMTIRAEQAEAKGAESARYFESMEKTLVETRGEADQAEALRTELAAMKESCREHEEGLNQLSETVMELQQLLDAKNGEPSAAPAPVVQAVPPPPPPSPQPIPKAAPVRVEPIKVELDFGPPPPPAPPKVVVPPPMAVPAAAASTETTLRPQNFFGPPGLDGEPRYMLHEILSKDALGVVYRTTERSDGRSFMTRFIAGQAGEDQTLAFEKEVEKLISLPHPNILHVQGSGRRKSRLYVMMDAVAAPTLAAAKIAELPRIVALLRDAASAVHYAHEEGVFHGDLTPENILVAREGDKDHALVKDFGLACLLETQTAGLRNPAFLPPEQVRVLKSALSAAVDVYGLGATLFTALTGRAPFEGNDPVKLVKRVMIEEPPPVEKFRPDVPKAVSAVVRRAMAKERGLRYESAQQMADALTKALDGLSPAPAPPPPPAH